MPGRVSEEARCGCDRDCWGCRLVLRNDDEGVTVTVAGWPWMGTWADSRAVLLIFQFLWMASAASLTLSSRLRRRSFYFAKKKAPLPHL